MVGEIENQKIMINRGEYEKMKRHVKECEINEDEDVLEKIMDQVRSAIIFKKKVPAIKSTKIRNYFFS